MKKTTIIILGVIGAVILFYILSRPKGTAATSLPGGGTSANPAGGSSGATNVSVAPAATSSLLGALFGGAASLLTSGLKQIFGSGVTTTPYNSQFVPTGGVDPDPIPYIADPVPYSTPYIADPAPYSIEENLQEQALDPAENYGGAGPGELPVGSVPLDNALLSGVTFGGDFAPVADTIDFGGTLV